MKKHLSKLLALILVLGLAAPAQVEAAAIQGAIPISGTVTDADVGDTIQIRYTLTGPITLTDQLATTITATGAAQNYSASIPLTSITKDGVYSLSVWAVDSKGAVSATIQRTGLTVDRVAPTLTSAVVGTGWYNTQVPYTITVADATSGIAYIQCADGTKITAATGTCYATANGTYSITVADKADNVIRVSRNITNFDNANPTVSFTLAPSSYTSGTVKIQATVNDALSGVKEVTLPDGTKVTATNGQVVEHTVLANGSYSFTVTDNAGNSLTSVAQVSNIDKEAPTLGTIRFPRVGVGTIDFEIKNATDVGAGVKIKNPATIEIKSLDNNTTTTVSKSIVGTLSSLGINEEYSIRYKLIDRVDNESAYSSPSTLFSGAKPSETGEVRTLAGTSATFKYTPVTTATNPQKYQLKAVDTEGNEVLSPKESVDTLITISGLTLGKTYKIYSAAYNNDDRISEWVPFKTSSGNQIEIIADSPAEITATAGTYWLSTKTPTATLNAKVTKLDKGLTELSLNVGGTVYKLADNIFTNPASDSTRTIEVRISKGATNIRREIEGNKDIFFATLPIVDGNFDTSFQSTSPAGGVTKSTESIKVGADFTPPTVAGNPTALIYVNSSMTIVNTNTSKITDLSSAQHEIQMSVNGGAWGPLVSQTQIASPPHGTQIVIKVKDKFDNETSYNVASNTPVNAPADGTVVEAPKNTDTPDDESSEGTPINNYTPTISIPAGGTHYQTSLDGVTWSQWQPKSGLTETKVTLPSGDGNKSVYIRTGAQLMKKVPLFNAQTNSIQYVDSEDYSIEAMNNTVINKFIIDLTAPKVTIRTMDNSLIAINGNITFLIDIIDNLDRNPKYKYTLQAKDASGNLVTVGETKIKSVGEGNTTGSVTLSALPETKVNGKLVPYTFRVEAFDINGNNTVEFVNFYVKNKN